MISGTHGQQGALSRAFRLLSNLYSWFYMRAIDVAFSRLGIAGPPMPRPALMNAGCGIRIKMGLCPAFGGNVRN
jgi:hypothetical protein